LFSDTSKTRKYSVWAELNVFKANLVVHNVNTGQ